jgi:peptidoglycan/xylan/chitin deacetylase (PgdA/CDA1 family)
MESCVIKRPNPGFGAFVLSLDFELHWGVRDHEPANGPYRQNLLGAREAIPRILELFERYEISATWATVGFLFASSRAELQRFQPAIRPAYENRALDPYAEPMGTGEEQDPLHFAGSLLEQIRYCPHQEIATHTFSHYYCAEPGQTRESFEADLKSAVAIAAKRGIVLRSIVFPRNQVNPAYAGALLEAGIVCYRGPERGWMHRSISVAHRTLALRIASLADSYIDLSGRKTVDWSEILEPGGLCNVRAGRFLRPFRTSLKMLEAVGIKRITDEMRMAARDDAVFHLWFHPHNFGVNLEKNLCALEAILRAFAAYRVRYGMRSLSMCGVAELVRRELSPQSHESAPLASSSTRAESMQV